MNKRLLILGAMVGVAVIAVLSIPLIQAHADFNNTFQDPQVTMKSLEVNEDNVQANLCILLPSVDQWGPFATLTVDGKVILNSEVSLINAKDPAVIESQTRCYTFVFPVSVTDSISTTATLKLEKLSVDVNGGLLTKAGLVAAKTRLKKEQPQIDFEMVIEIGEGGGGADIKIHSKPENMSDYDALQLILKASIEEVPGNWQTDVNLK